MRWTELDGAIKPPPSIRNLVRLIRSSVREVFLLSPYNSDLALDEGLDGDVKQAVTAKPLVRSKEQLKQAIANRRHSLSKSPKSVRPFSRRT